MPIPVIKPPITGSDMNFKRRSACNKKKTKSQSETRKVTRGTILSASTDSNAMPKEESSAPTRAAGAASTPNTKRGEEESRPKTAIGKREPYRP